MKKTIIQMIQMKINMKNKKKMIRQMKMNKKYQMKMKKIVIVKIKMNKKTKMKIIIIMI